MLWNTNDTDGIGEWLCREWLHRSNNGDFKVKHRHEGGKRKISKIQNKNHYLMKAPFKVINNWHDYWYWLQKVFQNFSNLWARFKSKEFGSHTGWNHETLDGIWFLANSCLYSKIERDVSIKLCLGTKIGSTKKTLSAKKSWTFPGVILPSAGKTNIYISKIILFIWWHQHGVVYYELLNPRNTIICNSYRTQTMNLSETFEYQWLYCHERPKSDFPAW